MLNILLVKKKEITKKYTFLKVILKEETEYGRGIKKFSDKS